MTLRALFKKYKLHILIGALGLAHGIFMREIKELWMELPKYSVGDCLWKDGQVTEIDGAKGGVYDIGPVEHIPNKLYLLIRLPYIYLEKQDVYKVDCKEFK
jgi:hypothetical protein